MLATRQVLININDLLKKNYFLIFYDHTSVYIAFHGQSCHYTEECLLTDPFAECKSGRCTCASNYEYDSYISKCQYGKLNFIIFN